MDRNVGIIKRYIEGFIIPYYKKFDNAHDVKHVVSVIEKCGRIAEEYPEVNKEMVYVIAAFHDIGLKYGRDDHEKNSAIMLRNDVNIRKWFSHSEINIMAEAIEDHRASSKNEPRSIYGKIVADGDRNIDYHDSLYRALSYSISTINDPDVSKEEYFEDAISHLREKYCNYLKLWLNFEDDVEKLKQLSDALSQNKEKIYEDLTEIWNTLQGQ